MWVIVRRSIQYSQLLKALYTLLFDKLAKTIRTQIYTTISSQALIHTADRTGAMLNENN